MSDDAPPEPTINDRTRSAVHSAVHGGALRGLRRGLTRLADQVEDTAFRLKQLAEDRLQGDGRRGRAGAFVHSTADWLGGSAEYFREAEPDTLRADLERSVIEKPVQTLLVSLAAGWVLGKIIR